MNFEEHIFECRWNKMSVYL